MVQKAHIGKFGYSAPFDGVKGKASSVLLRNWEFKVSSAKTDH